MQRHTVESDIIRKNLHKKKPSFRSWKSGKNWLYAATALAALTGAFTATGLTAAAATTTTATPVATPVATSASMSASPIESSSAVASHASSAVSSHASSVATSSSTISSQASSVRSSVSVSSHASSAVSSHTSSTASSSASSSAPTTPANGWDSTQTHYYVNGQTAKGQQNIAGHWYLFDKTSGAVQTSFQNLVSYGQNKVVYYNTQGQMLYNQQSIDGHWYLFDSVTGAQQIGRQYISAQHKWVLYQRQLGAQGYMLYGQQHDQGNWYLFDKVTGAMQYGRQYISEQRKWVLYDRVTGTMKYGQQYDQKHWYLFDKVTGAMQYGWQDLSEYGQDKIVYYNTVDGTMQYGKQVISGYTYFFNQATGSLIAAESVLANHRGNHAVAPEDSVAAVLAANFPYVENDMWLTKDGHWVVVHDPTIDRTTNGTGNINDMTLAQLEQYNLKNGEGQLTSQKIPTLEQWLAACNQKGVAPFLEIKPDPTMTTKNIQQVAQEMVNYGYKKTGYIISFDFQALQVVKAYNPAIKVLYIVDSLTKTEVKQAEQLGAGAGIDLALGSGQVDAANIMSLHNDGLSVGAWTVPTNSSYNYLESEGVNLITIDS